MAIVCSADGDGFRVEIRAGRHALGADEGVALGGTDTGPDPFDLLAAALGACTAITIVDAARERGLPLGGVRVTVSTKANKLPPRPADPELRLLELRRTIEILGDLSAEDRAWLVARGEDCAVGRSLASGIELRTVPAPRRR